MSHLPSPKRAPPRILLVEDNADLRTYVRNHLERDYDVFEARDGLQGLEQAREIKPDLVIADVMMPRMDGFTLTREIRSDEAINDIPIVLLTAKADLDSRIEGFDEGADDYLPTPSLVIPRDGRNTYTWNGSGYTPIVYHFVESTINKPEPLEAVFEKWLADGGQ